MHFVERTDRSCSGDRLAPSRIIDTFVEELPRSTWALAVAESRVDAVRALRRCTDALARHATPSQRAAFYAQPELCAPFERARRPGRKPAADRVHLCRARSVLLAATPGLGDLL